MKTKPFRRTVRGGAATLLAATIIPFAQNALAQEIEEVIVTGSRIARDSNLTGALPIQSVTADDIRSSGEFSLSDVVNDVPALLQSVTSEQSIDAGGFEDGTNILNLRSLGAERTLVLVDGRRHVGGLSGTSAVDIGSIPQALVERVEVLTGGASAIYGADAVTGVVNFILRDDFEGLEVDANFRMSEYGDAEQASLSAVYGFNFDDGRGNLTMALDLRDDEGLLVGDRVNGAIIGSARDWVNPDLRFQQGDIGAGTPNFAQYYDFNQTGRINFGLPIPATQEDFIADFNSAFGTDPTLTSEEVALINRAASAPQRALLPYRTFPFTSAYGYIAPGNAFTFSGFEGNTPVDIDGNGVNDCLDSFTGWNSALDGTGATGAIGGCWNIDRNGNIRPIRDGLVASGTQGFGGDGFSTSGDEMTEILLPEEKISLNFLGRYELNDQAQAFAEFKWVNQEVSSDRRPSSFWDLLSGAPDNPFLPEFIQPIAVATGGVSITVDPSVFPSRGETERDTYRFVTGVEGEFDNGWTYEFSANYGRFEQEITQPGSVINDRFFAAIDAVTDPATGQPACRAQVDPSAPAMNTPFEIPAYDAGYFSFTPGDGTCVPLNIWGGVPGASQQAIDWVTVTELDNIKIEQTVLAASFAGDFSELFELPGGAIAFAAGVEWREEKSDAQFDAWQRGVLPAGSPFGAGAMLSDVSGNDSLTFRPQLSVRNEQGEFDAADAFVELSIPLLADAPLAQELTLDLAGRYSDYSTIGGAESWKVNLVWAPVDDIAFRGGVSQAVRAPNVTELFGPETGTNFRPIDPCDAAQLDALSADNPTLAANTQANCIADFNSFGLDPLDDDGNYAFADPLTASFGGIQGGNRSLIEETADTTTIGFVFQPGFLEGFTLTADYWDIEIEDAIQAVSSQDIVNGCYQGGSLNASFCNLLSRNTNSGSAQFGGFNFLRSTDINFAKLETDGYDISANYTFDVGAHNFEVQVTGTKVESLNNFTNPLDLNDVDVELGEVNRPEEAGNIFLGWNWGNLSVGWQTQYLGEMLVSFLEIDTAVSLYGDSVIMDETWIHDLNATYLLNDQFTIYGGINNITQENPFLTDHAFPASPRGRMLFLGATYRM